MSLYVTSLNSGSNGNCYYIGNQTEAVLIDAGICCSEFEERMERLGLCINKLKAIFISHEHTDHISGLKVISKKYKIPVYITHATHGYGKLKLQKDLITSFTSANPINIGSLSITAFPKYHDAADPYSFVVSCKQVKVGVFTDIGTACENLVHHFRQCHAAFLETNYDETMLENGNYPYFLKNRIRGGRGHLSNTQALNVFRKHKPPFMSHLFLSHLSKNNNCPNLVQQLFNEHAGEVKMIIASRAQETEVYHISHSTELYEMPVKKSNSSSQLSFAFDSIL